MSLLPYIFIFNIDHTIVGDILSIHNEYELLNIISYKLNKSIDIVDELNDGLLRPYFKDFIQFIKTKYDNIELFVYTGGSHRWVNNVIIPNIEKAINTNINKPYFTRENMNNDEYDKILGNIYDVIIDNLKSKYPLLNQDKYIKYIFNNQLIFIDDIKNNLKDYPEKQILCPKYKYNDYYDVIKKIKIKYDIKDEVFNNTKLLSYCNDNEIPIYNENGSLLQKNKKYQMLLNKYYKKKYSLLNNEYIKDTFFKTLIFIMKSFKSLNNKKIELINKKLLEKYSN